jgi:hypothetical protein
MYGTFVDLLDTIATESAEELQDFIDDVRRLRDGGAYDTAGKQACNAVVRLAKKALKARENASGRRA